MNVDFTGKVIVVTGGASGMGAAHARAFVAAGGRVMLGDVSDDVGSALAEELGSNAGYHHLDVSSEDDWASFMSHTENRFGPISVMVNNAGIGAGGVLETMTLASWRRAFEINLDGTFLGIRSAIGSMRRAGGGSIVNISSFAGLIGTPYSANYTASKFGVRGLTRSAAMELAPYGIRVNSVHPGYVRTPMLADTADDVVVGKVALNRMAQPEDVSNMVVFLASEAAGYCTGAEFAVDGGWSAGSPVVVNESNRHYADRFSVETVHL